MFVREKEPVHLRNFCVTFARGTEWDEVVLVYNLVGLKVDRPITGTMIERKVRLFGEDLTSALFLGVV